MTGIETTIVTALTNNFIGQMIKSGWEGINKNELLNKDVGQLIKEGKYLFLREYTQRYWDRHGMIKVLKMSKPMDLESIYINVKCLGNLVRDYYDENLENKYRESKQRRFNFRDDGKKDGLLLANQEQYLMVLGDPGIGKSTFLRKVGLEALKGNKDSYQHSLTPVLLELKNFKENEINIQVLIEEEFKICGFPNVEKNISNKLEKGELLILLDGLDEVPTANVYNVIEKIQDFVDRHHKNRFILSCRTAARTHLRRFTDIEIVEFDDQQIQSFIEHWFSSELDRKNETAKNCWELLQKEEYKSAKELAHTPLLLTFLCLVYDENQSFPTNRSRLYQDALRILLEKWSAEKRLPNRGLVYENLSIEQEEILLSEIAYQNFVADKLFLEKREVVKQIKDHLKQNLNAPQHLDGEKVLKTIEIEQGILVERARDVYSFSHLTLQEYLTAQYIYDNDLTNEVIYTPPDNFDTISNLMKNLEEYLNDGKDDVSPLIKLAIQHFQFESIHPFYDGNGRTGRIINVLYLILEGLLNEPVLYLSSYIIQNKGDYYRLLQEVRTKNNWDDWILYMLKGIELTAISTIEQINKINHLFSETQKLVQEKLPRIYSKDLIEQLFIHPYCKIEFLVNNIGVERKAASRYLSILEELGVLKSQQKGKEVIYINTKLYNLLKKG